VTLKKQIQDKTMDFRTRNTRSAFTNNENITHSHALRSRSKASQTLQQRDSRNVLGDIGNKLQSRKIEGSKKAISKGSKARSQVKNIPPAALRSEINNNIGDEQMEVESENAFELKPSIENVPDIDSFDMDYPEYCSEYVKDIYEYLHKLQDEHLVPADYMNNQADISPRMRTILIDWLIEVHMKFKLLQETLYLTVSLIDRYLAKNNVNRRKLQLVGVSAMFIAAKFEEIYAPEVNDFVYITDDAYTREEILDMERTVLNSIQFRVATAYPLHFLRRASKVADADPRTHTLAKYLVELTLPNFQFIRYKPAMIAAACLSLAKMMLLAGSWNSTIAAYTKYTEAELTDCINEIFEMTRNAKDSQFKAIYNKYGHSRFHKVSFLAEQQIANAMYKK